jgi:hypothetical protein
VDQRSGIWRPREGDVVDHSALALGINDGLLPFFFGCTGQLPATQGRRDGNTGKGGHGDQPEPERKSHGIILCMKYLVILAFVAILGSLASALFFMMRGSKDDHKKSSLMFRALAMRVGFSILLFVSILAAWKLGYIQPGGIPAGR